MLPYCYLNGVLRPTHQASLGLRDLGILRGFGLFDFFLFRRGVPLFLPDYLQRFYRSAELLGLEVPVSAAELTAQIHELIAANGQSEGGIRLLLTGGDSPDGYTPTTPNYFVAQYAHPRLPDAERQQGCRLLSWRHQRELPAVKSTNYLTGILAQSELKRQGAQYLLYHDGTYVRESDRSNFLMLSSDGVLTTPAQQVLLGITRAKTLEVAKALGIPTAEREIGVQELATAREAYLTSSIKGVLAVSHLDGQPVADGQPGPVGKRLAQAFQDYAEAYLDTAQP